MREHMFHIIHVLAHVLWEGAMKECRKGFELHRTNHRAATGGIYNEETLDENEIPGGIFVSFSFLINELRPRRG